MEIRIPFTKKILRLAFFFHDMKSGSRFRDLFDFGIGIFHMKKGTPDSYVEIAFEITILAYSAIFEIIVHPVYDDFIGEHVDNEHI